MGHRAGIKQQNNGELPLLNLLMGSQWLPWLPQNYQPLDSLTSLHQPGCVCGGSEWCGRGILQQKRAYVCMNECVGVRPKARPQTDRQKHRGGPTVSDELCVFCVMTCRWWMGELEVLHSHSHLLAKLT